MRSFLLCLAVFVCVPALADQNIYARRVVVSPAQDDAEVMARTGVLRHCGRAGGRREGIGFSTVGPQQACESACFYKEAMRGRYRIVERGVARGPRGWFAVIRYE